MSKYGNRKVELDGYTFDSQAEARHYQMLKLMEQAGEITDLKVHPSFRLLDGARINGRMKPPVRYEADFQYQDKDGRNWVEDVKSPATRKNPVYRLKLHMMAVIRGIEVREVEA